MSFKKTVNHDIDFEREFVHSKEELETTPQETMLNKICALLVNEFNYWGNYKLSRAVYDIDITPYLNLKKQQALFKIRNELQSRFPELTWHILKAGDYVSWLLDDTYVWFE